MTSIKLLHVSAPDCNVQGFHYDKLDLRSVVIVRNGLKTYRTLTKIKDIRQ